MANKNYLIKAQQLTTYFNFLFSLSNLKNVLFCSEIQIISLVSY